jgi:hypothetical protein
MSKIDRVRPVRRYGAAKYPSHADPDPTTYPAPVEFPFHRELVRAVAGVGLAAAMFGTALSQQQDPPQNPFPLAKSGLPHRTSPYGTGQPSYMDDQLAVKLIHKVFKEEGFDLKDVTYEKDGVAFRPSGFDPKRRIGYVWGNWLTLDNDSIVNWMNAREGKPADPTEAVEIKKWFDWNEHKLKGLSYAQQKEAARLRHLEDDAAVVEGFKKFIKTFHDELLSVDEIKKLEEEFPKKKEFIAVISQFDPRFLIRERGWTPEVMELYKAAKEDPALLKKAEERHRQIMEEGAKEQLKTLERNVREYIAWARSQGLQ